jgi:hypothetical protein
MERGLFIWRVPPSPNKKCHLRACGEKLILDKGGEVKILFAKRQGDDYFIGTAIEGE